MKPTRSPPPEVTYNELSLVWKTLWDIVHGNPEPMTRHELQLSLGPTIPERTTLGCLRTFGDELLIKGFRDDEIIEKPYRESDLDQFCLTAKGTKTESVYPK